jgi:hypothetical protein
MTIDDMVMIVLMMNDENTIADEERVDDHRMTIAEMGDDNDNK